MGLFKRNKGPLIPPVAEAGGQQGFASDPYAAPNGGGAGPGARRTGPAAGAASSDPYASPAHLHRDPYAGVEKARARGADPNNPYGLSKNGGADADNDAARNELFAGMPEGGPQHKPERVYGYEGREFEDDFDEDEEVEGIKNDIRQTKMDSLASTRNTLRMAREAEETARGTVARLGDQSESLANSERHLDMAKANSQRAEDQAKELAHLRRSIFKPGIVWNKDAKRAAQQQRVLERHAMEREDRLKAMKDVQETRQVLGDAARDGAGSGGIQANKMRDRAEARKRFQFEATGSDDELEDELDENLDETLAITRRMKALAQGMGAEVEKQNQRLGRITDKTDTLDINVKINTDRLKAIK